MKYYNYKSVLAGGPLEYNGEADASLDPLETELAGEDVFMLPASATFTAPPETAENEVAVFDEDEDEWVIKADFRGQVYYQTDGTPVMITALDVEVPEDCTTTAPDEDFFVPFFDGTEWVETGVVYYGRLCPTKAKVDTCTARMITELGEEKAKTLKIIAGDGACPEWDTFVAARQALVDEGDQFIIDNELV